MPRNEWELGPGQVAINDVQISSTDRAGANANEQLAVAWFRWGPLRLLKRSFRSVEHHGAHELIGLRQNPPVKKADDPAASLLGS